MKREDPHLSDQQLLLDIDGELSPRNKKLFQAHLEACWKCRVRHQEIELAIAAFVRAHEQEFEANLPAAAGPRALLKLRLAELQSVSPGSRWFGLPSRFGWLLAASTAILFVLGLVLVRSVAGRQNVSSRQAEVVVFIPDSRLTPGAAILASRQAVCAQENIKNKAVSVALQKKVFEEYGIADAEPRAYEVDYLVTPALGGADDIRNLWPHSYSATAWNARVKDALEDRLRELVCNGDLDLTEAQREIAANWIAAYKKYFHTDKPLAEQGTQNIE